MSLWPLGTQMAGFVFVWSSALILGGLQYIAAGALLRLFINLEENTRAAAQALDRIRTRLESQGEEVGPFFRS
jgi:hypothetical protein